MTAAQVPRVLPNAGVVRSVAQRIAFHSLAPAVVDPVLVSRTAARILVAEAMRSSFPVGGGHGPLNHFHQLWQQKLTPG